MLSAFEQEPHNVESSGKKKPFVYVESSYLAMAIFFGHNNNSINMLELECIKAKMHCAPLIYHHNKMFIGHFNAVDNFLLNSICIYWAGKYCIEKKNTNTKLVFCSAGEFPRRRKIVPRKKLCHFLYCFPK